MDPTIVLQRLQSFSNVGLREASYCASQRAFVDSKFAAIAVVGELRLLVPAQNF